MKLIRISEEAFSLTMLGIIVILMVTVGLSHVLKVLAATDLN